MTKAEIIVVSWNIKDFGKSRTEEEIKAIAQHIRHADILAIQEVVAKDPGGAKAVARLADQLNRMGAKWDYAISDPTQSSSGHKSERYAYLWKTSKLNVTGGRPRLLSELASVVEREPYLIKFKYKSKEITLLNYHACTHTKDFPERSEIISISNWLLRENPKNVIWAGDMNLAIRDEAFSRVLSNGFLSAVNGERTSVKKECKNGNYLSKGEDNILYKLYEMNHKRTNILDFMKGKACDLVSILRNSYSDHFPVEVVIN